MGFFDRVRDVLTSSDAERAKNARKAADKAAAKPESAREDAHERVDDVPADAQEPAQVSAEADEKEAQTAARTYRTHTVRSGDTLASIAEHYGVDRHEMAELNRLDNPDLIYPGQVFKVPNH